jgi:hypothetical protein
MCLVNPRTLTLLGLLLVTGCHALEKRAPIPEAEPTARIGQLVVYSDFPLPKQHRLLRELADQRELICEQFNLAPTDEPIYIHLFHSLLAMQESAQAHFTNYPQRRAFFVETETSLRVFAHWGDRAAEDLRHEVTHGYLHAMVRRLPLWLDEGIAEYFEVSRGEHAIHHTHLLELKGSLQTGWFPSLVRLEKMTSAEKMTQLDYAESWAWTHFMLHTTPERKETLRQYLREVDRGENAIAFSQYIEPRDPSAHHALVTHLKGLIAECDQTP